MIRFLFLCLFASAARPDSLAVLDEAQIQQLEVTLAKNPGDRQAQAMLGQNYALAILGITKLGKYDMVEDLDPAKAASELAQRARAALHQSYAPVVLGEGGYALWKYCTQVEVFKTLKHMANQSPLRSERSLATEAIDRAISIEPDNGHWRTYRIPILSFRAGKDSTSTFSVADA